VQNRKSIRLKTYNYAHDGVYFVTLCVAGRQQRLSHIEDSMVELSREGAVVEEGLRELSSTYSYVTLDAFVIMPDHLHILLQIDAKDSLQKVKPLGQLIGAFKVTTTKRIRHVNQFDALNEPFRWQRNFYERVVRDEIELNTLRAYIDTNPSRWKA
jgi:REP element-mobilizing transposase RayT